MVNMKHYARVIYWSDDDGKYIGELPELCAEPCCHGDSVEAVNKEIDEIEALLVEELKDSLPARGVMVFAPGRRRNWSVNNRVADLRRSLGLNQKEFAARIGASLSSLQKWERGERVPSGSAAKLLEVLERNPELV